jgi:hypothetical protein
MTYMSKLPLTGPQATLAEETVISLKIMLVAALIGFGPGKEIISFL